MASRKTSFTVTFTITALVLIGIAIFFNGIVSREVNARLDLTEDQIYTVSDAAKSILSELKVPVHIKLYITAESEMPTGLKSLERDITDKLAEFRAASGGKLTYSVSDPSANEELAQRLQSKGIQPFQVQSIDRDEIGLKLVWSALEITYKEKEPEILPRVTPQTLDVLEYEICRNVIKLTQDKLPVLAIYSSRESLDPQMLQLYMQMGQQPPQPRDLYTNLPQIFQGQGYDVRQVEITRDSPIPDDTAALLILAPKNLSERQRYEINRYLQRGGKVFCAVQENVYDYGQGRRGGFEISARSVETGIEPLLRDYGLRVSEGLFMDENLETLSVPRVQNVGGLRFQTAEPVQAPMQIKVGPGQFAEDVSVVDRLGELLYLWGSRLVPDESSIEQAGLDYQPLFFSSKRSWEVDAPSGPLTQQDMTYDPELAQPQAPLAAILRGDLPNAFAEGEIPAWGPADSTTTGEVESFEPAEGTLILVGCAKMFEDSYLQAGAFNNGLFLMNCVDVLTLGDELIKVRAKTAAQRGIEPISEGQRLFWRIVTTVLVPVLVALYGILRMLRRRRNQAAYLAQVRTGRA